MTADPRIFDALATARALAALADGYETALDVNEALQGQLNAADADNSRLVSQLADAAAREQALRDENAALLKRIAELEAPVPTPTPVGSGIPMPTGNLVVEGYTLEPVFADDFDTPAPLGKFRDGYGSRWGDYGEDVPDTNGKKGSPSRYSVNRTVSVRDGLLNIHHSTINGVPYGVALQPKPAGGNRFLYGSMSYCYFAEAVPGWKAVPMAFPFGKWPENGELNFIEGALTGMISGFMHRQGATSGSDQDMIPATHIPVAGAWHVAQIIWLPNLCIYKLDGVERGRWTKRVPNTPMFWNLQHETETSTPPVMPPPDAQGDVKYDWVVVYRLVTP